MARIELANSRTLVLGGSGVLGGAIATELSNRGGEVMLAGRDANRLQERANELGPGTPSAIFDLQVPSHAPHIVEIAAASLGGLDGVVNAAGITAFGPLVELDDDALDELVATDLVGPLRIARASIPHLEGGFIVNITGVVAETPVANMAVYSAVKAGLSAASSALGRELRRQRIHVLDARPPHTETGLASRPIAGTAPTMPQGLEPSDVARAIVDGLAAGRRTLAASDFLAD